MAEVNMYSCHIILQNYKKFLGCLYRITITGEGLKAYISLCTRYSFTRTGMRGLKSSLASAGFLLHNNAALSLSVNGFVDTDTFRSLQVFRGQHGFL